MKLKQLENLVTVDEDVTDDKFGTYYDKRSVEQLLNYGLILLDKPPGPTSHQVVAWAKKILEIPKAGHSGTLDPQVTGVLPLGLGDATKALGVLLFGSKEYQGLGRLHSLPSKEKLDDILKEFCGDIYQRPPQRSAVSRQTRIRKIFELELLEQKERLILIRIACESGTYIRKLIYDIGEVLGPGATMVELRRTRVSQFHENHPLVTLHQVADAGLQRRQGCQTEGVWSEDSGQDSLRHPEPRSIFSAAPVVESTRGGGLHPSGFAIPVRSGAGRGGR